MVLFIFSCIFGGIAGLALIAALAGLVSKEKDSGAFAAGAFVVFIICTIVATGTISIAEGESTQQGEQPVLALTSDGMNLELDITIWFYLDGNMAPTMYREVGPNYIDKILKPAIRTSVRDCVKNLTATVAYTSGRDELQVQIQTKTKELCAMVPGSEGLQIVEINIRNIKLPDQITTAIEAKLEAQQQAQQMEFVLQKERLVADQRIIEASGLAESQRIIDASLTDAYLQWKYIQALELLVASPSTTTVILPYDSNLIPMLNIPAGGTAVTPTP
jgi:regulator of protease activity HflC (stomatin/prohibitin superfamily)